MVLDSWYPYQNVMRTKDSADIFHVRLHCGEWRLEYAFSVDSDRK